MKGLVTSVSALAIMAMASGAQAASTDGSLAAGEGYGAALAVQTNETSFGDNQSELNAGYGFISGGKLRLAITGQVEANFNKLEIWIDAAAGGQSVFSSAGNDGASNMDGLVFDTAFTPETHIIVRNGFDGGLGQNKFDLDFANLGTGLVTAQQSIFGNSLTGADGIVGAGAATVNDIIVGYDNSNVAGVGGGGPVAADQAAAAAVTTGLELVIDLGDLGYAGGDIRVSAVVNSGDHGFASNQVLGGLPIGSNHLAGLSGVDFSAIAGDQFFTIAVPEPASVALLGLGGLAMLRRRA
jgi:PEP-CTERM motif